MFATVTTWRISPSIQSVDAQNRVLPEMTSRAISIARQFGILDFIMVPVAPDSLIVVSSYESETDANDSGPPLLTFLTQEYGNELTFVRRVVGAAYEPSDFVALDRQVTRDWRGDATEMYANINRYRLDPSIHDQTEFENFLNRISTRFLAVLSELNLLDMLVVRTDEELLVVRLFENPAAFDEAIAAAKTQFTEDPFEGRLQLVDSLRGRAFDASFLINAQA